MTRERDAARRGILAIVRGVVIFTPGDVEAVGESWIRNTASRHGLLCAKHPGGCITVYRPEELLEASKQHTRGN